MAMFSLYALQYKNLPRINDIQFRNILNQYGFYVTLRKRTPIVDNPTVCPCVANDDVFHQIDPDCPLCGGTGIIGGESFRDYRIKMILQPRKSMGMYGSEGTYTYASKMERVQHICYVAGDVPVDIGDFIIDTYKTSHGERTIEYEVFDKEIWWIGQGPNRKRTAVYQMVQLRKTEYPKTIAEVENY